MRELIVAGIAILLGACTTSMHGSFVATSHDDEAEETSGTRLGSAEGRSCQTRILYIFPKGDSVTTDEAISNAKNVHQGTRFIADISIDDETLWGVGYSVTCIVARATAFR